MTDIRLLHTADIHLGHRQYNLSQRERDMVSSFNHTIKQAEPHDADAIIIPGDLFHSRDLRPRVLQAAEQALETVPNDIPILVSPGNHDENLTRRPVTWLEYLHRQNRITLLQADLTGPGDSTDDPARMFPSPTDAANENGTGIDGNIPGYIDLTPDSADGPIRVFGLQYRGGYIDTALEDAATAIEAVNTAQGQPSHTVLLAHFGVEEEAPDLGATVRYADLTPLEPFVDYLALGHIHKPYEGPDADPWLFNPGSLEAHDTQEATWDLGYFITDLNPEGVDATHHQSKRRPFYRFEFEVDHYKTWSGLKEGFQTQMRDEQSQVEAHCKRDPFTSKGTPRKPVIDLRLTGHLNFDRRDLDINTLESMIIDAYNGCYCQTQVGVTTAQILDLLDDIDDEAVFTESGALRTDLLEDQVFEQIAETTAYSSNPQAMAQTLTKAKIMAIEENAGGEAIADHLQDQRRDAFSGGVGATDVTYEEVASTADRGGVDTETFQAVHAGEDVDPVEASTRSGDSAVHSDEKSQPDGNGGRTSRGSDPE